MKKLIAVLCGLCAFYITSYAQSNPNFDFSSRNFTNWKGYTGTLANCCSVVNPGPTKFTIMTNTTGTDPNSCYNLPFVPPGESVSARIGNLTSGGYGNPSAQRLTYDFTVTAPNTLLLYWNASVLVHAGNFFRVALVDSANGTPVLPCAQRLVAPGAGGTGDMIVCGQSNWKQWEREAVDLSAYVGQKLRIEFSSSDCLTGEHYGCAYVLTQLRPPVENVFYCANAANAMINAPAGFKNYLWSNGDTSLRLAVAHPQDGAQYTCTFSSRTGCQAFLTYTLRETKVTAAFATTSGSVCRELLFADSSVTNNGTIVSWHWNFDDTASGSHDSSSLQFPVHLFSIAGNYTVKLTIVTSEGCVATVQKNILVQEAEIAAGFTTSLPGVCRGLSFMDTSATAIGAVNSWSWHFGDPASGSGDTSSLQNPLHIFSSPGTYTITFRVRTSIGCSQQVTKEIIIPGVSAGDMLVTNGCMYDSLHFSAKGAGLKTVSWDFGDQSGLVNGRDVIHLYHAAGDYRVTAYYIDSNHCADNQQKTITVYPLPEAAIRADPAMAPVGDPVIKFQGYPRIITAYAWDFGDGSGGDARPAPVHTYPAAIAGYTVVLKVTDEHGCSDTAAEKIRIVAPDVFVPDAFSPDGDGKNDVFRLRNLTYQKVLDFSIYNRYGQRVFQAIASDKGWDGRFNGQPADMGTYYYHILLAYPDGTSKMLKGDVTLIR